MSESKYHVDSMNIQELLVSDKKEFVVPPFQRAYSWNPEFVGQLMDDVFSITEAQDLPYFLGSIVLTKNREAENAHSYYVLDGQQRLATLSLLIAQLIEKLRESGKDERAGYHRRFLFSERTGKPIAKLQLQPDDNKLYRDLISNPEKVASSEYKKHRLVIAMKKISEEIEKYKVSPSFQSDEYPYEPMLNRLLYDVEIVAITAPDEREAFRLFETLNDRGLDLSAADLVKNKIFSRCVEDLDDVKESWRNLLLLTKSDDVVTYLRTFWIAFHYFVRKNGLYDAYKSHIEKLTPKDAALFALELEEEAKSYSSIVAPSSNEFTWEEEISDVLERLKIMGARSCRPLLLVTAHNCPNKLAQIAKFCESITVRYSIVGEKNPSPLERLYDKACEYIRTNSKKISGLSLIDKLVDVPKDSEFKNMLLDADLKSVSTSWHRLLIEINRYISSGSGEAKFDERTRVNVEHILPLKPSAAALAEASISEKKADEYSGKLGNLTLLSGRKNREAQNRPFSEKKKKYQESDVYMTRELCKYKKWGEKQIRDRTIQLAEIMVKLWPDPREVVQD